MGQHHDRPETHHTARNGTAHSQGDREPETAAGWSATWKPDYERRGTTSGIQIYEIVVDADAAVVLCLVGNTRTETAEGVTRSIWRGSPIRDTWTKTPAGWKRRKHEKLTVNEQLVDGRPAKQALSNQDGQ